MKTITNNEIKCQLALEALKNVIDPEIGLNIVDLGLIYQIDFNEQESGIQLVMTLTTQFCPMGESITEGAKQILEHTFAGSIVEVELSFNPPWNADFLSEAGKTFLGR